MKKTYYDNNDVKAQVLEILRVMHVDKFVPDYVVGITRGGLVPAQMISQYLDIPMETLKISFRDGSEMESNCWMAEDACGYNKKDPANILIVDDINDTGKTLKWLVDDWASSVPHCNWNMDGDVFNYTTRFATLVDNDASEFQHVDYSAVTINKAVDPQWIVFPWETWWKTKGD